MSEQNLSQSKATGGEPIITVVAIIYIAGITGVANIIQGNSTHVLWISLFVMGIWGFVSGVYAMQTLKDAKSNLLNWKDYVIAIIIMLATLIIGMCIGTSPFALWQIIAYLVGLLIPGMFALLNVWGNKQDN